MSDTLRGSLLMVFAMACFAVEDALIKTLGGAFASGQIVWLLGLNGAVAVALAMRARGMALWTGDYLRPTMLLRLGFEAAGTLFFVSSLVLIPLAVASAILQATPLMVALGATVFLGARVGPRRWAAIATGFAGVLLILRPGAEGFDPAALLAVGGMVCLAGRDLATRATPAEVSGLHMTLSAFAGLVPAGLALNLAQGPAVMPGAADAATLAACLAFGLVGYSAIVVATRIGDIAVVSSLRYSRMVFALMIGVALLGERPDLLTYVGMGVVIAAGLYALVREARVPRNPLAR